MENVRKNVSRIENDGILGKVAEITEEVTASDLVTVAIIAISAILVIALLFVIAVFIDCRHQKKDKERQKILPNKKSPIKFPKLGKARAEDRECFADKMVMDSGPSNSQIVLV